jgi:hypothetical protein
VRAQDGDLFSNCAMPAALFSLWTRIKVAIVGQTTINVLSGRPGKSFSPLTAPSNQKGMERAKINKMKFRSDLRCGAVT